MCSFSHRDSQTSERAAAARNVISLLTTLLTDDQGASEASGPATSRNCSEILVSIKNLIPTLTPESPIFAAFHNGLVHDPLGAGSYAFQNDIFGPVLAALVHDEHLSSGGGVPDTFVDGNINELRASTATEAEPSTTGSTGARSPTRPIVIHARLQPNNSPHIGTVVVFCCAFAFARGIQNQINEIAADKTRMPVAVSVQITFVDTAPVKGYGIEVDDVQYQRSYRDIPEALAANVPDYEEIFALLSTWSDIPFTMAFQSSFFSDPTIPSILRYMAHHHDLLGLQLSPKYGMLALRASCPVPECGLAEKHSRKNVYQMAAGQDASITFRCPVHGPHTTCIAESADVARLEANAPARNLIRSMSHMLDTSAHHIRVTGADYAGMYQEAFLYRPLAAWSAATGLAAGRTPHILYAPLITDWSGAKLSKTLYVRENGYRAMEMLGTDGPCSFARLKSSFGGDGAKGLRRIWEVERWVADPRKLFRTYSIEYLQRVVMEGSEWES